jgi:DNA-binding NarL/FixJ family response regulator
MQDGAEDPRNLESIFTRATDLQLLAKAHDTEAVLSLLMAKSCDVVVLDLECGVTTETVLRLIRTVDRTVHLVVLQSSPCTATAVKLFKSGANACFAKDTPPLQILTCVRAMKTGLTIMSSETAAHLLAKLGAALDLKNDVLSSVQQGPSNSTKAAASGSAAFLSPRELEVLRLIVAGASNQEIADRLVISLSTAKAHVRNILTKLAVADRTQAAVAAMRLGLVEVRD